VSRAPDRLTVITPGKIVRAYRDGGVGAVALLCADRSTGMLHAFIGDLDGRPFAPWQQTRPGARYARCGTCGEVHHFGLATHAHAARHARERFAKRILEAELLRRRAADAAARRLP
jgi:hypothetical protein